jgi:hypothetical protein
VLFPELYFGKAVCQLLTQVYFGKAVCELFTDAKPEIYIPHYIINCRVLKENYYITIISQLKENYYITITSLLMQSFMFLSALSICKRSCIVAIEKPNVLHEVSLQSVRRSLVTNFGVRINQLKNFWHISILRNRWVRRHLKLLVIVVQISLIFNHHVV